MNKNEKGLVLYTQDPSKDYKDATVILPEDGLSVLESEVTINETSTLRAVIGKESWKTRRLYDPSLTCKADGRVYYITGEDCITRSRTETGVQEEVLFKELWYELSDRYITAHNIAFPTTDLDHIALNMVMLHGNSEDQLYINGKLVTKKEIPYEVGTSMYNLAIVLYQSGWQIDTNTLDLFPDGKMDLESDKKSVLENIMMIQEQFGGMLLWDSVNSKVALVDERKHALVNKPVVSIRYQKNLSGIRRIHNRDIATVVFPYGKDYLNIADVNNGIEYLSNYEYTNQIIEKIVQNNDIQSQEGLLQWGKEQLAKYSRPRYSYDVDFIHITPAQYQSLHKEVRTGDLCIVFDEEVTVSEQLLRVISVNKNLLLEEEVNVTVGEPRSSFEGELIHLIYDASKIKSVIDSSNNVWARNVNSISSGVGALKDEVNKIEGDLSNNTTEVTHLKEKNQLQKEQLEEMEKRLKQLEEQIGGETVE